MHKNALKNFMADTMTKIHKASSLPADEQWFTRGDVARHLKAPSTLNAGHCHALDALVAEGTLDKRIRPAESRIVLQYRMK
jgi:hypothetical protein